MAEELYTSGRWTVKPGHEDEFIAAWSEFAEWSRTNSPGASWALLLRDRQQSNVFTSLGPWESAMAVEAWRASDGFRTRIGRIRGLLDGFEAATLDPVARVE